MKLLLVFVAVLFALCGKHQVEPSETHRLPANVDGSEISRLPDGQVVRFSAVLGDQLDSNCVEIFVPSEYEKYSGDAKWAIPSRLVFNAPHVSKGTRVIVTGKMIFIRESPDTRETCGTVTGRLFDITAMD